MVEFDQYYKENPEKKETDDAIRKLPDLGEPGSRSFEPHNTPMISSIMSVVNHITRDIDWPAVEQKTEMSSSEATPKIKAFAKYLGADLVGTTFLNPSYIYSHVGRAPGDWGSPISLNHTHAIAIAVEMRSDMMAHAPDLPITIETSDAYFTTAKIAMVLAKYINLLGYEARAHVDGNYRVMCVPVAVDAGLGELGRLGLLITPQYGPRMRLAVVTTNLPFEQAQPMSFGVRHFCTICKKCAENCPSASIPRDEQATINGVSKWQTQQDSCYRFWRKQGTDCGVCIRVCPYAYPDLPMHRIIRWMVTRNNVARYVAFKGDAFFYGRKPRPTTKLPDWLPAP
jgi:ferredoxin